MKMEKYIFLDPNRQCIMYMFLRTNIIQCKLLVLNHEMSGLTQLFKRTSAFKVQCALIPKEGPTKIVIKSYRNSKKKKIESDVEREDREQI